jgi:acyl-CoA reductase-like NAD-dependent aldehyde dehydrogenase
MTIYRNFIGGEWIESASAQMVKNINPANTNDVIGTIKLSTREEARKAVESAYNAFKDWKTPPRRHAEKSSPNLRGF